MRARCLNPKSASYHHYGARGITVCAQWVEDYDRFFDDMGDVPDGFSLERIDNAAGYSPTNCRWANLTDQLNNQRRNVLVAYAGRTQTIGQWAAELEISYDTLWRRLRRYGMDPAKAFTAETLKVAARAHGTRSGYDGGCRCEECRASNAARARRQRAT